ncbi:Glucose-repressible alcohol dehydrogenase transcriptional effector [Saitoella coloradoensis]
MADSSDRILNGGFQPQYAPFQRLFQPNNSRGPSRSNTNTPSPTHDHILPNAQSPGFGYGRQGHPMMNLGPKFTPGGNDNHHGFSSFGGGGYGGGNHVGQQHGTPTLQNAQPLTPFQQEQLEIASLSRKSSGIHNHAKVSVETARTGSRPSAAVTITDPNHPSQPIINGLHRKDGPTQEAQEMPSEDGSEKRQEWRALDLGGVGTRNLAQELFKYTFITQLYINHNKLTLLPPDIKQLKLLTQLDVSGNQLTSVPVELGMLTNLKELFLVDNQLTTLPAELGTLYQLKTIGIEGNPLNEQLKSLIYKDGTVGLIKYLRDSCPVPLPPPERQWYIGDKKSDASDDAEKRTPEHGIDSFNVFCYNILCDKYATSTMYGYTPSWALSWDYRKELILQEVMSYAAEIVCLQEVDIQNYEDYFAPQLAYAEYKGVFWPKGRAKTMREEERRTVDGCATFYKTTTFDLLDKKLIEFSQIAMSRDDFKKTDDFFDRVQNKDNIATVTLLENKKTGGRVIAVNAHIHWDPRFKDVKLVQVALMMDEIHRLATQYAKIPPRARPANHEGEWDPPKYSNGTKIPLIICGDFNSIATSGVYEYLSKGIATADHSDFGESAYGALTSDGITHPFAMKSAYANHDMQFTNYTPGFAGVIDYIWYTTNALEVKGLLGGVDESYLERVVGFPNAHFPSDHIGIMAEFKFKKQAETKTLPPPDFGESSRRTSRQETRGGARR